MYEDNICYNVKNIQKLHLTKKIICVSADILTRSKNH